MDHGWLKGTTKCTNGDIAHIGEQSRHGLVLTRFHLACSQMKGGPAFGLLVGECIGLRSILGSHHHIPEIHQ